MISVSCGNVAVVCVSCGCGSAGSSRATTSGAHPPSGGRHGRMRGVHGTQGARDGLVGQDIDCLPEESPIVIRRGPAVGRYNPMAGEALHNVRARRQVVRLQYGLSRQCQCLTWHARGRGRTNGIFSTIQSLMTARLGPGVVIGVQGEQAMSNERQLLDSITVMHSTDR